MLKFETTKQRSENMRAIKATSNGTTERRFRAILARNSVKGWKLNERSVVGKPDFFFEKEQIAVFIDGCFWHGCPKCGHLPKANRSYWLKKLTRNKKRDSEIRKILKERGIQVIRIWECQLRIRPHVCLKKLIDVLALSNST